MRLFFFFFFQAEDGIRDRDVTGVQTCALPISLPGRSPGGRLWRHQVDRIDQDATRRRRSEVEIGSLGLVQRGEAPLRTDVGSRDPGVARRIDDVTIGGPS